MPQNIAFCFHIVWKKAALLRQPLFSPLSTTPHFTFPHSPSRPSHRPPSRCLSHFFSHNAHHLYALPLLPVTPACSFGAPEQYVTPDLIRCLSHFFSRNAHHLYALPLFSVTPAPEPVPLPHSKNEFLKKLLNQVQGDISCVCRILQSTSISCISLFRINAIFLLPTMLINFTHCLSCTSHRPPSRCLSLIPKTNY